MLQPFSSGDGEGGSQVWWPGVLGSGMQETQGLTTWVPRSGGGYHTGQEALKTFSMDRSGSSHRLFACHQLCWGSTPHPVQALDSPAGMGPAVHPSPHDVHVMHVYVCTMEVHLCDMCLHVCAYMLHIYVRRLIPSMCKKLI